MPKHDQFTKNNPKCIQTWKNVQNVQKHQKYTKKQQDCPKTATLTNNINCLKKTILYIYMYIFVYINMEGL